MLMPSIFGNSFMNDFFDFPEMHFGRTFNAGQMMQTDVSEKEGAYEVDMNLPGFSKDDVKAELKDGYLTITADTDQNNDRKDEDGRYIRRERYVGTCSRSFYVGDAVTQEDIKARFENGVLKLMIPKKEKTPEVEQKHFIQIEG